MKTLEQNIYFFMNYLDELKTLSWPGIPSQFRPWAWKLLLVIFFLSEFFFFDINQI